MPHWTATIKLVDIGSGLNQPRYREVGHISPTGTAAMSFGRSAFLCVDFTNRRIFFFGQLQPPISAYGMVLGEQTSSTDSTGRRYLVSITTPDLVAAQAAEVTVMDVSTMLLSLPQTTPLPSGAAIFATLNLKGKIPTSRAISVRVESTMPQPTLTFCALIPPGAPTTSNPEELMVSMKSLYLLGGALEFDGTAAYNIRNQSLTANGSMVLTLSSASCVTLQNVTHHW
ncbi:uncharacterized protein FSUBG_10959 [Fusarium subglutinans]|uniref:Uncharacterized protein n=1 Tax=Gibberella subglutinans TaxID=42677 RepID=A0A8H5LDL7_GIBSU|nr:uncharacterized protein FSUBG_10959 [Fusarium subglutinans]KAF5589992.1 hypothetical protein FSUBG_10959 [Fusarium subglutinans]